MKWLIVVILFNSPPVLHPVSSEAVCMVVLANVVQAKYFQGKIKGISCVKTVES